MTEARRYAAVAVRYAWAALLLRLGLRERWEWAYGAALSHACALADDWEDDPVPPVLGYRCEHMTITGVAIDQPPRCWVGDHDMRPVWPDETNRTVA